MRVYVLTGICLGVADGWHRCQIVISHLSATGLEPVQPGTLPDPYALFSAPFMEERVKTKVRSKVPVWLQRAIVIPSPWSGAVADEFRWGGGWCTV